MERRITIYFDDGERITRRDGRVTHDDEFCYELDERIIIPKRRVIRAEVLN